jgi:hypothetical protein
MGTFGCPKKATRQASAINALNIFSFCPYSTTTVSKCGRNEDLTGRLRYVVLISRDHAPFQPRLAMFTLWCGVDNSANQQVQPLGNW